MSKCICGEINARNCPVHNDGSDWEFKEMINREKTCELCNTPVKVVGHTTLRYESAYDSLLKEAMAMREALSNTLTWLNRMSHLRWDDPEYAPRFKIASDRHNEAVLRFDKWLEENKP